MKELVCEGPTPFFLLRSFLTIAYDVLVTPLLTKVASRSCQNVPGGATIGLDRPHRFRMSYS